MSRAVLFIILILSQPAFGDVVVRSGETQSNLIELYTSEGCSSCPPADRWLSTLKDHPALWQQVVPVAFHVDYWDYIGWKDRFARPEFGDRQRRYAIEKGLVTVYTPGVMSNGKEWRNFSWRPPAIKAADAVGPLVVQISAKDLTIEFQPIGLSDAEDLTVNVALLGFGLKTEVLAGENAGRELRHDFVVLEHAQADMSFESGRFVAKTDRPRSNIDARRYALAFWVAKADEQAPLQAVGTWIEETPPTS